MFSPSSFPTKALITDDFSAEELSLKTYDFVFCTGTKDRKCKEGTTLLPEDPEPWIFKGGIAEELEVVNGILLFCFFLLFEHL